MTITVTGTIERQDFGPGIWTLVTSTGETYELKDAPPDLHQANQKVTIQGEVREDIMTLAMIGPVLEVQSFEVTDS